MAAEIRLGTSSFTAAGWPGAFYPSGMKQSDYLNFYGSRFDTVEVDSTFYRIPTTEAVNNWALKTPPGFIFSVKVPQVITHEKILLDCDAEWHAHIFEQQALASDPVQITHQQQAQQYFGINRGATSRTVEGFQTCP